MVTAFAVVTVFMGGAVPDSVCGLDLFTEMTVMRKRKRFVGVTRL